MKFINNLALQNVKLIKEQINSVEEISENKIVLPWKTLFKEFVFDREETKDEVENEKIEGGREEISEEEKQTKREIRDELKKEVDEKLNKINIQDKNKTETLVFVDRVYPFIHVI